MESNQEFKNLLSPFKIRGTTFKNRFVFLPHHTGYGLDGGYGERGLVSDRVVHHYVERAKGGAAAVTVAQSVSEDSQMSHSYLVATDKRSGDNLKRIADGAHKYGSNAITQLTHCGHTTLTNPPQLMWAPSQMNEPYCHNNTKEIEKDEMMYVKDNFIKGAAWQKELGWDGVELKIAHDGILRPFLSPYFNRREDEYGGSFENRMRFPLEVIAGIREAVGPDYPIGIRFCVDEFSWYGYSLEYGLQVAKAFEEGGVDYISTDAGTFTSWYMQIPPSPLPLGWAVYQSAALKRTVGIPITAFGRINDPVMAEQILEEGSADLIGMARQLICDPETPNKVMEGRVDDIRHCIACNDGCVGVDGIYVECIQNPGAGREKLFGIGTLKPAEKKQQIMVVGAGCAGLKLAEIAARRGHSVEVYEKENAVGGQLRLAEKIPYRNEIEEVYRYLRLQLQEMGVPIHLGVEVDEKMIADKNPEVLVIATGSKPLMPDFDGLETATMQVMDVREALKDVEKIGNHVIVYDDIGYWQGGGTADFCLSLGADVTMVTPSPTIGEDIEGGQRHMLMKRMYDAGIKIIENTTIGSFDGDKVILENVFNHEKTVMEGIDTVLVAWQSSSINGLYKKFKGQRPDVYSVGDCVAPRQVEQCIFEAELLGRSL